jgi:hypothetical protein
MNQFVYASHIARSTTTETEIPGMNRNAVRKSKNQRTPAENA